MTDVNCAKCGHDDDDDETLTTGAATRARRVAEVKHPMQKPNEFMRSQGLGDDFEKHVTATLEELGQHRETLLNLVASLPRERQLRHMDNFNKEASKIINDLSTITTPKANLETAGLNPDDFCSCEEVKENPFLIKESDLAINEKDGLKTSGLEDIHELLHNVNLHAEEIKQQKLQEFEKL